MTNVTGTFCIWMANCLYTFLVGEGVATVDCTLADTGHIMWSKTVPVSEGRSMYKALLQMGGDRVEPNTQCPDCGMYGCGGDCPVGRCQNFDI